MPVFSNRGLCCFIARVRIFQLFKKNIEVDIVISGHTHVTSYEMFRGISYINPGSAVKPRGRKFGTVSILDLADINLRPEIIEIKNGS